MEEERDNYQGINSQSINARYSLIARTQQPVQPLQIRYLRLYDHDFTKLKLAQVPESGVGLTVLHFRIQNRSKKSHDTTSIAQQ